MSLKHTQRLGGGAPRRLAGRVALLGAALLAPWYCFGMALDQAIALAIDQSPEIETEQARVRRSETAIDIERDGYFPSLQGSVEFAGGDDDVRYELRASQTLYDWGLTDNRVSRAQFERDGQTHVVDRVRETLALDVTERYLDWLSAVRRAEAIEDQITRLERLVDISRQRLGAVGNKVEVTRAELALARAGEQLIVTHGERDEAAMLLEERTGRYPLSASTLTPAPSHPLSAAWFERASLTDLSGWIKDAPRVLESQAELEVAEAAVKVAETENLPRISLDGVAERIEGSRGSRTDNRIGLRLETPLFQGLSAFRRPKAARYGLDAARQDRMSVEREIRRQIKSALTLVRVLGARQPAITSQLASADVTIELYLEQFQIGRRDVVDLVGAESERIEAVFSRIDIDIERARLIAGIAADLGQLVQRVLVPARFYTLLSEKAPS